MSDSEGFGLNRPQSPHRRGTNPDQPHPSAVGSPLPIGGRSSSPTSQTRRYAALRQCSASAGTHTRQLLGGSSQDLPTGLQRAVSALRSWLPFVQRILPMLDGNFGTAVSNILTPYPQHTPPPPLSQRNLEPIEDSLAELQTQHLDLRNQVAEQNTSLKRVEDQLELVREATDRNTLEQQELLEDLKGVGNKVNVFALVALALLVISVLLNVILYLHIQRVLP